MAALAAVAVEKKPRGTPDLTERKVKVEDVGQAQPGGEDMEGDIGEIKPDHYYEGGKVPVFKPVGFLQRASYSHLRPLVAFHN
jgi:hypothetical protein